MSAPAVRSRGGGTSPGWAKIGPAAQFGTFAAAFVLFCVSGGMLWLVGYNYDGLAGSAATKIHPSTYLIVLTFAWSMLACGDPVSRGLHLANRRPATLLMLVVSMAVIAVTIARDGAGIGGIVDTYIASCLLVLLLADADEVAMARLETMLHVVMALNALLALGEFVSQIRLFPYRFDGAVFATDTRSAGLHGHPLANAVVTACYLMALLNGSRGLSAGTRMVLIGLQSAALVVFGGRTAVLVALFFGVAFGLAGLLRALKGGRVSLLAAAAGFALVACLPAAVGGLIALGFFDDLVSRFVSDGGSANARKEMFALLGMFPLGDLIIGPDPELVDTLRRVNGLEWGIENPIIRMILYQGVIVTTLVMVSFGLFMAELIRVIRPGLWLPMIVWIVLLNGSESIATKTTLPAKFAVIALCMYRPGRRATPVAVSPAWSGRARPPSPGPAAG